MYNSIMMGHTYGQEVLVEVLGRDRVVSADEHGQTHAQASRGRNGLHNLDQSGRVSTAVHPRKRTGCGRSSSTSLDDEK